MSLLDFSDSGSPRRKIGTKWLLALGGASVLATIGITITAGVNLNTGNSFNYGQGVVNSTSCDNTITLTPFASFSNQSNGTGKFTLDSVYLEGISQSCIGADFIIRVYDDGSSTPITITDAGTGTTFSGVRIWFKDATHFQGMGNAYVTPLAVNEAITGAQEQGVQVVFDADALASFADAKNIFKITIESVTHDGTAV